VGLGQGVEEDAGAGAFEVGEGGVQVGGGAGAGEELLTDEEMIREKGSAALGGGELAVVALEKVQADPVVQAGREVVSLHAGAEVVGTGIGGEAVDQEATAVAGDEQGFRIDLQIGRGEARCGCRWADQKRQAEGLEGLVVTLQGPGVVPALAVHFGDVAVAGGDVGVPRGQRLQ
jgi:hypothetical protein